MYSWYSEQFDNNKAKAQGSKILITVNVFFAKETRKKERRELMKKEQELAEKLAAQAFAKAYLQSLVPNVFMRLCEDGLFLSPVRAGMNVHVWMT